MAPTRGVIERHFWCLLDRATDRVLQDNPTLQGRPIVLLHRRSIVLVGMARHHVRRRSRRGDREGDAPSFLMPRKDDFDSAVVASDMPRPDRDRALSAATMSSDDRERGRSGALFPAKSLQADTSLADISTTIGLQKHCVRLVLRVRLRRHPIDEATVYSC